MWAFVLDQVLHLLVMAVAAWVCIDRLCWSAPVWLTPSVLQYNQVSIPSDPNTFHAGQLIGILERWLILVFILIGHYEVIGFLIAAKSIIRFGDHDREKTEYFLAGTLLSIAIAVGCGLLVLMAFKA